MKVAAFIDGFNFYHAVDDLGENHLKWVNLRELCVQFAPSPDFEVTDVFYFSAYATWRPNAYRRHREYVKSLKAAGVTCIMGKFKPRSRKCNACGHTWQAHEEKETDVNIALYMLSEAAKGVYDRFLLISGDSDLAPAVRIVRDKYPQTDIRVIAPVGRKFSWDLLNAAGGKKHGGKMKKIHLERSLFAQDVTDSSGTVIAIRPTKYDPPEA